ncbi:MAG: sensor histidine kinase [Hyphomicrobiaceae bacterium]|nr:sensor histidine kinase [Hyphomicrobiaceae bacterium]
MMSGTLVAVTALIYLLGLFAIAFYADRPGARRHRFAASPVVYSLSIAVYCTSWTFFGSVGRAAETGLGFLPIYVGPTIVFVLGFVVLRKILAVCKAQRITSIADFIASRYGKSQALAALVVLVAVTGTIPYIALQLKAVGTSLHVLLDGSDDAVARAVVSGGVDSAAIVAAVLGVFAILFGTRQLDATEHHAGMVVAIAFESVVKLLAFAAVGLYVTYGLFDGFADIFARAAANPDLARLMTMEKAGPSWITLTLLSMAAALCLPRQFHVTMVENTDERHLASATWMFPAYLFLINIFVLPIAFAGLLLFPGDGVDADTFVLALPLHGEAPLVALLGFVGGLSAATAMVIVASVALSIMVSNDLIMPALLRYAGGYLAGQRDLSALLLGIRRGAILAVIALGYLYLSVIGDTYALVSIGLVSFCAAAQLAPALLLGLYWRGGTGRAATAAVAVGFAIWAYTLFLPSFARSGFLPESFIVDGPFGIASLRPYALFGLDGLDTITHALFWSMLGNVGTLLIWSSFASQSLIERTQATLFVEIFRQQPVERPAGAWRGGARVADLRALAERFVGRERAAQAFAAYAERRGLALGAIEVGDNTMIQMVERLIAGAIGAASARVAIAYTVKGETVGLDEVMQVLDETTHVLEYSRELEQKSRALELATAELKAANTRLEALDRMKDEFMSTVSHELRTPLTSIRSFSEILREDAVMPLDQRQRFLDIIVSESERLTRLVNQVLDLSKIEAGRMDWHIGPVDMKAIVQEAATTLQPILERDGTALGVTVADGLAVARGDHDRLVQVVLNLLSNAAKFVPKPAGAIAVTVSSGRHDVLVVIADNGPGLPPEESEAIFERFHQVRSADPGNPGGTGLGLTISKRIVEHLGGRIWVERTGPTGSEFRFTVPAAT